MPPRLNLGKAFLRWHGLTWLILTSMFNGWGVVGPPGLCGARFRPPFQLIGIPLLDRLPAGRIGGNRPVERAGLVVLLAQQTA